ncbi:MAG: Uma2 family endonuclease [Nannocystaceae bacterium]
MPAPIRRRASYEDVLAAPSTVVAEVIFGVLHTQPRPSLRHANASSHLGGMLFGPYRIGTGGPGGWVIYDEPELHLGGEPDILVPDLAGWRRERLADLPDDARWTSIAPDWICEVLSPSTQAIDRAEKMEIYLRERVGHAWLVDPVARTLEVYRLGDDVWQRVAVHRDDAKIRAEPFDAVELSLGLLWER